jgi:hypothetical protein
MFIREAITQYKITKKEYKKHVLVESSSKQINPLDQWNLKICFVAMSS